MKRITHDQGSPEWLLWRQGGIGGSDTAAILNIAPASWTNANRAALLDYKANHRGGYERKTDKNKTAAMLRGTMLEPVARQAYRDLTGNKIAPGCGISDEYDWMRASFDGINDDGSLIVEIKVINHLDHERALNGNIPPHYYCQVVHQLIVSGAKRAHYFSYSTHKRFSEPQKVALVPVKPSEEYRKYLIEEEVKFWRDLQDLIARKKKEKES